MSVFHIYTDGACKGNPGLGAWGFVVYNDNDDRIGSKYVFDAFFGVIQTIKFTN